MLEWKPLRSNLSSQALHLVPVLVKTERSSTRMGHVCAGLVLFSTMNWILKALLQIAYMTANLRSVVVFLDVIFLHIFKFLDPFTKKKSFICLQFVQSEGEIVWWLWPMVMHTDCIECVVNIFQVYRRCDTGQIRLAASRKCASPSNYSCNITCGPHGGTLDVEMGMWLSFLISF